MRTIAVQESIGSIASGKKSFSLQEVARQKLNPVAPPLRAEGYMVLDGDLRPGETLR